MPAHRNRAHSDINRSAILAHIGIRGSISRAELARMLGVTPPLVTQLTRKLIADGVIRELEYVPSRGGRPAQMLGLVEEAGHTIGVKVDIDQAIFVEVRIDGAIERSATVKFDSGSRMAVAELTELLRDFVGVGSSHLLGIGVGIPGTIGEQNIGVVDSSQLGWNRVALGSAFRRALELPVLVDSNINASSVAENLFGQGCNYRNFLVVTIGTSIELGIVCNSEVFRGHAGGSGGLSHLPIDDRGPLCQCGNNGCLEAYVGEHALVTTAHEHKLIGDLEGITSLNALASAGNQDAEAIFQQAGHKLGRAIAGMANILDPEIIILFEERIDAWTHLAAGFEPAFRSSLVPNKRGLLAVVEKWQPNSGARSAACLILAALFDENRNTGEQGELIRARLLDTKSRINRN